MAEEVSSALRASSKLTMGGGVDVFMLVLKLQV
jgi:hypothetical protein